MAKRKQSRPYQQTVTKSGKDINLPKESVVIDTSTERPELRGLGHPSGLKESILESLIKSTANKRGYITAEDDPYLEQYLHPDYDILEPQSLRPTKNPGTKYDKLPYRRVDQGQTGYNTLGLGNFTYDSSNPAYDSIYDVWDFETNSPIAGSRHKNKTGMESIIPSIEDFMAKEIMKRMGKPYQVYERVPKGTAAKKFYK